jgi:hypothetical protein
MKSTLRVNVGGLRKFWRGVLPKMHLFSSGTNCCAPIASLSRAPCDAKKPGQIIFAGLLDVLRVNCVRNIAQICNPVVQWIAVLVVNLARWPSGMSVKPSQSMGKKPLSTDGDVAISSAIDVPSFIPNTYTASFWRFPNKYASVLIVVKHFAQTLRGKITSSHDAVPSQIG